jgi:hypothetical protein
MTRRDWSQWWAFLNDADASDQPAFIKSVPGCPGNADGTRHALRLRSTEQVFNYLGLLAEENSKFLRPNGSHHGCPRLSFAISSTPTDYVRFLVEYRGSAYYVSDLCDIWTDPVRRRGLAADFQIYRAPHRR